MKPKSCPVCTLNIHMKLTYLALYRFSGTEAMETKSPTPPRWKCKPARCPNATPEALLTFSVKHPKEYADSLEGEGWL